MSVVTAQPPVTGEPDPAAVARSLGERVKELRCLYGLTRLIEQRGRSLDDFLTQAVELLPPAWQYPSLACARITLDWRVFRSRNFRETAYRQASPIRRDGQAIGRVEVCYLEPTPEEAEGPFLREERDLIDAVAARIGSLADYLRTESLLQADRQALADANAALRAVVAAFGSRQDAVSEAIRVNVDSVLMPLITNLASVIDPGHRPHLDMLRRHLSEITSPFISRLSQRCAALSPAEMRVCEMIRQGLSTKEIAAMLHRSPLTIKRQREDIRRKLGLTRGDGNLTAFLRSVER